MALGVRGDAPRSAAPAYFPRLLPAQDRTVPRSGRGGGIAALVLCACFCCWLVPIENCEASVAVHPTDPGRAVHPTDPGRAVGALPGSSERNYYSHHKKVNLISHEPSILADSVCPARIPAPPREGSLTPHPRWPLRPARRGWAGPAADPAERAPARRSEREPGDRHHD